MNGTYKAVEVSAPGVLRVVERAISKPAAGQVRLRVEACGVCHSDLATVQGDYPGLKLPRVPGHEVVGRIEEIGPNVSKWKIGQRVGVGFLGGQDGECEPCLRGDFANCLNPVISGITTDGGYAEVMIAEARALASIPDDLTSAEAAPLLCAGITTYNALRNAGLRAGDLVGIQGIGGLGHLGVQFARRMGFRTVASAATLPAPDITRSSLLRLKSVIAAAGPQSQEAHGLSMAIRPRTSTSTCRIRERSTTSPWSLSALPTQSCSPPRTDSGRPYARAARTASCTSLALSQKANSAGGQSTARLKTRRAPS